MKNSVSKLESIGFSLTRTNYFRCLLAYSGADLAGGTLVVYLTKADGSKQLFDIEKVVRTCMRMGASSQLAFQIAQKVESRVYDGMPTKKVLQLIFKLMRKHKIRRLLVMEHDRPVGVVSLGDLAVDIDRKSALGEISAAPPNK